MVFKESHVSGNLAMTIGTTKVYLDNATVCWCSGLAIDADGSPHAYAPVGSGLTGLDYLANAGQAGNWYGLVCVPANTPVIQGANDPAPGFYVSSTALVDSTKSVGDPHRYVDSETVPYISISPNLMKLNVHKGDLAFVYCQATKKSSPAIIADIGPHNKLGEGSIALAQALGLNANPKHGGADHGIVCVVFPGSLVSPPWPRNDIASAAQALLDHWGGLVKLAGLTF